MLAYFLLWLALPAPVFNLFWPTSVLLTDMPCTCSFDWPELLLGSVSPPKLGLWVQEWENMVLWWGEVELIFENGIQGLGQLFVKTVHYLFLLLWSSLEQGESTRCGGRGLESGQD